MTWFTGRCREPGVASWWAKHASGVPGGCSGIELRSDYGTENLRMTREFRRGRLTVLGKTAPESGLAPNWI